MIKNPIKPAGLIIPVGALHPAYTGAKAKPYFYGPNMLALTANRKSENTATIRHIRNITNNLRFYNKVVVKVSLYQGADAGVSVPRGHMPYVKAFAADLIDGALRQELDRETAIMARGENVASNQLRRRTLGTYLLSKPYRVIKNFYGASMQKLAAAGSAEVSRESNTFYSDITHERTDKTVYAETKTQIERAAAQPVYPAAISDGDLNRIASRAVQQVERKMRAQRERNGKW